MLATKPDRATNLVGPIRFARYAYGPNRLGYCGPDDAAQLFGEATVGDDTGAIRRLAEQFEGAFPYLQLIASSNGIADPLDERVVEAYWLGSALLDNVTPQAFGQSLDMRFRRRLRGDGWHWLADKPNDGAVPMHAFHVLDVFPRLGLLRSGSIDNAVSVIDSCRIRWGRVLERDGDHLVVSTVPLIAAGTKLCFGPQTVERVRAWQDGAGFIDTAERGDTISIHWDWACEKLDQRQLAALIGWTAYELRIANQTM